MKNDFLDDVLLWSLFKSAAPTDLADATFDTGCLVHVTVDAGGLADVTFDTGGLVDVTVDAGGLADVTVDAGGLVDVTVESVDCLAAETANAPDLNFAKLFSII